MSGRCKACNVVLNDDEMTMKYPDDGSYVELCMRCLGLGEEGEEDFLADITEDVDA